MIPAQMLSAEAQETSTPAIPTKQQIVQFTKSNAINCFFEPNDLKTYSKDFGNLGYSLPVAVVIPENTRQIQAILAYTFQHNLPVIARGAGHSQSGQSLAAAGGVMIDMRKINSSIELIENDSGGFIATCDTGVTLRQLTEYTIAKGYLPPVLPFYLDLTVGGVLSAGGIGSSSHLAGCFISNVISLEVVKSDGSLVICSPTVLPDLFYGMIGTFGQFGIITRADLRLIKTKKTYHTQKLFYKDMHAWLNDYHLLTNSAVCHLQGTCVRSVTNHTEWNFLLETTFTTDGNRNKDEAPRLFNTLNFDELLQTAEHDAAQFMDRYKMRFQQMKTDGKFEQHHPFLEFIIAEENVARLIEYAIEILPAAYEDSFRLIYINKKDLPPYFMVPEAERVCLFAILPTGINDEDNAESLEAAAKLHQFAMQLEAKRYLSGWIGMTTQVEMDVHYAGKKEELARLKKRYDPTGIFHSLFSQKYFNFP